MLKRAWTILFVLVIPYFAIVFAFPLYDRVYPFVLQLPFLYFWIFLWLPLTSLCMYIGWRLDPLSDRNRMKCQGHGQQSIRKEDV